MSRHSRFIERSGGRLRFDLALSFLKPFIFIVGGILFGAFPALAQSSSTKLDEGAGELHLSQPWESPIQASVFGQFRFESLQYMSVLRDAPSLTNSEFLSGRITAASFRPTPLSLNWAADVSVGTFFSAKQSYYSVQELYVSTPLDDQATVSLGRKKYEWTEIDRIWSLGLWQPRYAIDALRPEDQGLTGLFFDYKSEMFQLLAFGSSLFIPTMGPDLREEDGTIKADNRWYRPPSRQAGNINVSYKLDIGDQWKLASQDSFALKMRLGKQDTGPWVSVAGGRKPVNDLILQRSIQSVNVDNQADFVVSPKVDHHQVFSADMGYQFEVAKVSVSYYEDHPEPMLPPQDYAIQELSPIKIYSAQLDWNVRQFLDRSLQVQLAYLKSYGDSIQDITSDGSVDTNTIFNYRYRFSNAALARVMGPLTMVYARPLITQFSYIHDYDQKGSILGLEFQYQWNQIWSFLMGADILGPDDPQSTSDGFINTFRANDRVYAGASYVF